MQGHLCSECKNTEFQEAFVVRLESVNWDLLGFSSRDLHVCDVHDACIIIRDSVNNKGGRLLPQCCPLCWYRETASSTPSIPCCPVSATLCSRTTRTCRRTPPSRNPSLKPTQCPRLSRTRRGTASRTHRAAAATQPFRIRHPAPIPAARSRCQVSPDRGFDSLFLQKELTILHQRLSL